MALPDSAGFQRCAIAIDGKGIADRAAAERLREGGGPVRRLSHGGHRTQDVTLARLPLRRGHKLGGGRRESEARRRRARQIDRDDRLRPFHAVISACRLTTLSRPPSVCQRCRNSRQLPQTPNPLAAVGPAWNRPVRSSFPDASARRRALISACLARAGCREADRNPFARGRATTFAPQTPHARRRRKASRHRRSHGEVDEAETGLLSLIEMLLQVVPCVVN